MLSCILRHMQSVAKIPEDVTALKALVLRQAADFARREQEQQQHWQQALQGQQQHWQQALQEQQRQQQTLAQQALALQEQQAEYQTEIERLREQIRLLLARRFGASSEASSPDQLGLFHEAMEEAAPETAEPETVEVPAHQRAKRGRRPLPEDLPRREVIHDLSEEEKICPHDGARLEAMGEDISEQLDIIPARMEVIRHIRRKYACPCCERQVRTAALPPQPIPQSIASPGLLAYVATAKYVDALPLYRQEVMFQRLGADLPRATFANWMIQCGQLIQPLINLMRDQLLAGPLIQMDETRVQVLKEPEDRPAQSPSWMWVSRGGPPGHPLILYDYHASRGMAAPLALLEGYQGVLQTDGYRVYRQFGDREGMVHMGCWAHARRKFDEAVKAQGRKPRKAGRAYQGLARIQKLYRIERSLKQVTPEARYAARQEQAKPLLQELRTWLDQALAQAPPKTAIGKALHYLQDEWPRLIRYLDDGGIPIDNNLAENAIRPFVVGRKNWLFSHSVKGVEASANLYSLVQTAKANRLEPYQYLRQVFTELPRASSVEQIEALLPGNVTIIPAPTTPPHQG